MIIDTIKNILLIFCICVIIFCLIRIAVDVFLLIKNNNTYNNRHIIIEAIYNIVEKKI